MGQKEEQPQGQGGPRQAPHRRRQQDIGLLRPQRYHVLHAQEDVPPPAERGRGEGPGGGQARVRGGAEGQERRRQQGGHEGRD